MNATALSRGRHGYVCLIGGLSKQWPKTEGTIARCEGFGSLPIG